METLSEQESMAERLVWWLAIIALVVGGSWIVSVIAQAVFGQFPWDVSWLWPQTRGARLVLITQILGMSQLIGAVLLFISGFGLLRRRAWGRQIAIIWSIWRMVAGPLSSAAWIVYDLTEFAASPGDLVVRIAGSVSGALWGLALPVLYLVILGHDQVKALFDYRGGRGFEAILPGQPIRESE